MNDSESRIISIYNHKGGVGKTLVASTLCFLAALNRIKTLAVSMDRQGDLIRWISRGKSFPQDELVEISDYLIALYSPNSFPSRLRYPLIVVDESPAWEDAEKVVSDICLVPVDCIDAVINFMQAKEWVNVKENGGAIFFVVNNGDVGGKRDLEFLRKTLSRQRAVEVWPGSIPHSGVFRRAFNKKVPVWDASYADRNTEAEAAIIDVCWGVLTRLGFRLTVRPKID